MLTGMNVLAFAIIMLRRLADTIVSGQINAQHALQRRLDQ
jgi:hypothetical protein